MKRLNWKSILRKKSPLLFTLLLLFSILCFYAVFHREKPSPFQLLCQEYVRYELESNTFNLHFTMSNPNTYGISSDQVSLPPYIPGEEKIYADELTRYLTAFSSLPQSDLTEKEAFLSQLVTKKLEEQIHLSSYLYYDNPLSPHSGQQSTIMTLLSEYNFYCKEDIDDYLELISLVPPYLNSLTVYMENKIDLGLSPGSDILLETANNCRNYFPVDALMSGTHFLQESFDKRLHNACKEFRLSKEEIKAYTDRHNNLLKKDLRPAYETLAESLEKLAKTPTPSKGLACYPDGKEYYEALLQAQTGKSMSDSEVKTALTKELNNAINRCMTFYQKLPQKQTSTLSQQICESFPYKTPEAMLEYLKTKIYQDFPPLPLDLRDQLTSRLCPVSESLQNSSAPAFYLVPPIDRYRENVIYINPKDEADSYGLFTTLAHEGYPGHLYQTLYSFSSWEEKTEAPLRCLLSYPGFQEGYAFYVELKSYDYVSDLLTENGLSDMACYIQYEKENRNLQLCLLTLLEYMIHEEGAEIEQISSFLDRFGITDSAAITSLYNYIVSEPCCYTKYYLGYLEIMSLKEMAMTLWNDAYNDYTFHTFLLDYGPTDFNVLKNELYKYPKPSYTCP